MGVLYSIAKKAADRLAAALLLVVLSPLMLAISAAIKIDSKGPAIYRQKRVGKEGRLFTLYKFRTMKLITPKYMKKPKQGDKRVTPLGRFLRRTCLDELPQLFNVLKGNMSLVGPRPEMPFIAEKYNKKQMQRLAVKPGLTGLWQVARLEGKTGKRHIHEDLKYDLQYIKKMNFFLDLKILAKTAVLVIKNFF